MKALDASRAPRVKICGLTRLDDARMAARAGASYLGAVLSEGYARSVDPGVAAAFASETGRPLVGVLVDETPSRAAQLARATGAGVLQLHGSETPETLEALRDLGDWQIWKAMRVRTGEEVLDGLDRYGAVVDGLLLDGWHAEHQGGSGARFPWDLVAPLREAFPTDVVFIAAGGLNPENVAEAALRLRPDVVDVSSGVEVRTGVKDAGRVRSFIRNVMDAFEQDDDQ